MSSTQQRAIALISKPPAQRPTQEIDLLLPWLKKKSQLFESLEKHVIIDIVRSCKYERCYRDHVIIRQGENGDCFYIILNGTVSVFIDSRKSGEDEGVEQEQQVNQANTKEQSEGQHESTNTGDDEAEKVRDIPKKKPLDRSKYGKFVIKFESGRSFGEIALISEDSVRNASIIADETTDLLVIHRDLYNQTLKAFQEKEYEERRDFANNHPLFRSWSARFRHLLEMSLVKEVFTYDTPIVRQGEPVNGLLFITKGRAKVEVAPNRHAQQYPEMKPFKSSTDVYESALNRPAVKEVERRRRKSRQSLRQSLVAVRRRDGYAAAERKVFFSSVGLCSVEAGEVLGDVEVLVGMDTHLATVTCTAPTEVFYLTAKNYERLVTKKNPATMEVLRELVLRKLRSRADTRQGSQIPLLKHVLFRLTEGAQRQSRKMPPLRMSKELPDRDALFNHLLSVFVQNKAQLIEPHVPGAVYYREMMREKARIRDNVRRHTKRREDDALLANGAHRPRHPRTMVALRNDLQRQIDQQRQLETKWLIEELRAEERLQLMREFQRLKPLPGINEPSEDGHDGADREKLSPPRPSTAERLAAEKLAAAEANGETAKQYGVFEMPIVREWQSGPMNTGKGDLPTVAEPDEEGDVTVGASSSEDRTPKAVSPTEPSGLQPITLSVKLSPTDRLETVSNPEMGVNRGAQQRRGAESAYAFFVPPGAEDNPILVTELVRPHLQPPVAVFQSQSEHGSLCHSKESLLEGGAEGSYDDQGGMKFVSPLVRSRLNLGYENPEYRDWETSEKTLSHLEERIRNFSVSKQGQPPARPVQPPKLARFQKGDDEQEQPRPGGRVLIRRRPCPVIRMEYRMPNHRHTRYRILPRIPNYDQMKKAKMLAYMTIDDKRHGGLSQSTPSLDNMY